MTRANTIKCTTASPEATEKLAENIGMQLRGGEVIELASDLGGGKTTFVRGLARGFGSKDRVASPTFTISKVYDSGSRSMYHFDFYRLADAGLVGMELAEVAEDSDNVLVIEWAGIVNGVLPSDRLRINIKRTGEESRELIFSYPDKLAYLVNNIC